MFGIGHISQILLQYYKFYLTFRIACKRCILLNYMYWEFGMQVYALNPRQSSIKREKIVQIL